MKKTTYVNNCFVFVFLLFSLQLMAQNYVPFTPRFNQDLKGDIVLIGNNILGPDNNAFNNNSVYNHNVDMRYIDIDSDPSTFSSSSADLVIANPNCYQIIYAGLYWGAVTDGAESITDVKFKGPSGGYNDVTGTIIFNANGTSVDGGNSFSYACFADVTDIVTAFPNDLGTYTVANVSSAQGETGSFTPYNGTGYSAGWSLFIVYEDPTLPGKSITSFDGFSAISVAGGNPTLDIPVSGFRTVPAPAPVRANFAFATLEGDSPIQGDQLLLNGLNLSAVDRPVNNFFNSSVTQLNATPVNNRNPNSTNTLGFDTGVMVVPNPSNAVIANNSTSATVTLETTQDTYFQYFFALAVDIIEPNIVLTKIVEDVFGNDIGGQLVDLGDELNYVIGFQNTGNDDATNLTIRDILPTNIVFNYPADIGLLPPGVTVQSYDPVTRELIFSVDNSIVEENDPVQEIRFKVTVVRTCSLLNEACSNIVSNQAYATYNGTLNPTFTISDDPSFNTNTGCLINPGATNFLADINCVFEEEVILCGASTTLTAAGGYDSYSWSTSPSGTPVIGNTQSITVTNTGTYYVRNTATAPCQSIEQEFNVVLFGADVPNPIIPFADEVVTCPNDGKLLPNIFLCGANDARFIETGITDSNSIIWEKLDESSCTAVVNLDCANEDASCTWNQVQIGPDFLVDTAGQYRITLNYDGGCFNQFYFNVYTNLLIPTVTSRDIICTTPGEIVVGSVPSGYEYSIDGINYQLSNVFVINTPNIYSVYVRQIAVTPNPCIFSVPDVQIRERDFSVSTIITQPYCNSEFGTVRLAANDARPQYYYSIYQGATLINSVGPVIESDYTFANLNPGTYTVNVSTDDGCTFTDTIDIIDPPLLTATVALTKPLTCTDGELTVYPEGGTPPYFYFVNSTTVFQDTPIINVSSPGVYDILVVDSNNCTANTSIRVNATPPPVFNITKTDILCPDSGDIGAINVNVSNANGNTLQYSIDNGITYSNSPVFTGLAAGNYNVVVQYSLAGDICETIPQSITINIPPSITATLSASPYTCLLDADITVSSATGGTGTLLYSIDGSTFQAGNTFTGLKDGTYTITIRDDNNCRFVDTITIDPLNPPTDLTFSNSGLTCATNAASVTITGTTGGVGTLEYQIIAPLSAVTPYQTSNVFSGLAPDTYTFQVKDANDCIYAESYTIAPILPITIRTVLTKDLDCTASPNGIISGFISGGTAPYTYDVSFNGGAFTTIGSTGVSFNYTAVTDGTFQFQITDTNGCTAQSGVQTVNAISLPEITSVTSTPNLCFGDTNGTIQININNTVGTPPFTINVRNDTTGSNFGSQTSGLPSGDYTITLTDSKSCTDTATVTIVGPDAIVVNYQTVDVLCDPSGISSGSVIIDNVTGGTAPYTYYVTSTNGYSNSENNPTGSTSTSFNNVNFGLYQINVIDANGCSFLIEDVLVASPPDDLDINITATSNCLTGGEVLVELTTLTASVGPFYFSIYTGPTSVYPNPPGTWIPESTTGSKSATFTGLIPGVTYTFIVYDTDTGCSYYETAAAPIPTNSSLSLSALAENNITCLGSADGNVSFTVNSIYGSDTNIDYEIYNSISFVSTGINGSGTVPALGSLSINNLGPLNQGTYVVLITETSGPNAGCGVATVPFNINESTLDLNITASVVKNANCSPSSGVITALAQDGTAPYLYQITTTPAAPLASDPSWASANTFNVDANSYYVHVKDAYGCIKTTGVVLVPPDPEPVISGSTRNQCTVVDGNFEIDVVLTTAGIAPHSYSIDGGAFQTRTAPFTISNLSSGVHTIEVQDANGCGNIVNITIEEPVDLIPTVSALPTCNDDDGEITVLGIGGSGNYTYSISPSPASISLTGNVFSGVPSGTYMVSILDVTTLCTADVTVYLAPVSPFIFTLTPISAITCFGGSDGGIEIDINNYTGNYTYEVLDSSGVSVTGIVSTNTATNPLVVSGLPAGNFTVVVNQTDSPFCTATSSVITIDSPIAPLNLVVTETSSVTCANNQGTITAVASGGWGNYEYELTGSASVAFSPNGTFSNLTAGNYTINVRDALGCLVSDNIILNIPPPINATVTANTNLLSCFGDTNATITVSGVTGGQVGNYSYTLNMISPTVSSSGPQLSPIFDGLGAGVYEVVVTDGYNCSFNSPNITITEPTSIEVTLVKDSSQTCLTDTTLTLSATGGTGIYEYSNDINFTSVIGTFASSVTFSVLDGTYMYYVRDANGCLANASNEITIDPLPALTVNLEATNVTINCAGDNNGVIVATGEGGLGSYVYTLQDTAGNNILPVTQNSPGVFTDLPVGIYQVRLDSGDCLTTSSVISITEPSAPLVVNFNVTNVACNGSNNGVIDVLASGGTGIIKYAISPQLNQFFETSTFENLASGTYQIIAQDELGCFVIFDVTITEPAPVILNIVPNSIIPEVCEGDLNGEFSIDISGGNLPYSVVLDDINGTYTTGTLTQTQFDFTGLSGGDHTVYVIDNLGCESEWNITFPQSVLIDAQIDVEYCTVNTDAASNRVIVYVDDNLVNLTDIDYSLDGGAYQASNIFNDVAPGNHDMYVRHTNSCEQIINFNVEQFLPLQLVINDGNINEIVATATGGSGSYEYEVTNEFTSIVEPYGNTNTFTIYESANYTVTVTDSNGCVASATGYFEFIDVCITNYFTPNDDGNLDEWGPGCTNQYKDLTYDIFDRYGRKVATLRAGQKWDGKYNGIELPTGDYWYVVRLNDAKDKRNFVGHFTLYR